MYKSPRDFMNYLDSRNPGEKEFLQAVEEVVDEVSRKAAEKIGREKERVDAVKVAAEIEATRVIAEDIKKANAAKRAADRALKDAKENRG